MNETPMYVRILIAFISLNWNLVLVLALIPVYWIKKKIVKAKDAQA